MGGCDTQTLAEHDAHSVCRAEAAVIGDGFERPVATFQQHASGADTFFGSRPQKRCASALHSTICLGPTYLDTWLRVPMAVLSQAVVDTIGLGIGGCRMRKARSRVR
jgi:hypothetical protein